jgi:N-acetyl-anhydromuramyl-L-alanine amidase AmpD
VSDWAWLPSPHHYVGRRGHLLDTVIVHYTAGKGGPRSVARLFANPRVERSAHLVVGRHLEGTVQCVDLDDGAWHAGDSGRSRFPRAAQLDASDFVPLQAVPVMPREVNCRSVGIEICNRGWAPRGSNPYVAGKHANPGIRSTSWESYDADQVDELVGAINRLCMLRPSLRLIAAHEDVTNQYTLGDDPKTDPIEKVPGAKGDVGPAFPWHEMPKRLTRVRFDFERLGWTKEAA